MGNLFGDTKYQTKNSYHRDFHRYVQMEKHCSATLHMVPSTLTFSETSDCWLNKISIISYFVLLAF